MSGRREELLHDLETLAEAIALPEQHHVEEYAHALSELQEFIEQQLPEGGTEYKVTWRVEVTARDRRDAAEKARSLQRSPLSWAVKFYVTEKDSGPGQWIDLLEQP